MLSTSGTRRLTGLYWVSGSLTCTPTRRPQRSDRGVHRTLQITAKAVQFTLQTSAGKKTPIQKVMLSSLRCCLLWPHFFSQNCHNLHECFQDFCSIGTGGGSDLLLDGQKGKHAGRQKLCLKFHDKLLLPYLPELSALQWNKSMRV